MVLVKGESHLQMTISVNSAEVLLSANGHLPSSVLQCLTFQRNTAYCYVSPAPSGTARLFTQRIAIASETLLHQISAAFRLLFESPNHPPPTGNFLRISATTSIQSFITIPETRKVLAGPFCSTLKGHITRARKTFERTIT